MNIDSVTDKIVYEVISRGGFDNVWDDMDDDLRKEMKDAIAGIIERNI